MKNIEEMLLDMNNQIKDMDENMKKSDDLNDLEKRRIYDMTMEKIAQLEKGGNTMKEERGLNKGKKVANFCSKHAVKAAIIVGALAVCSGSAYAAFNMNDNIRNYFGIHDQKTEEVAQKMISNVDMTQKQGGVAITMKQVIGDDTGFYAVMQAKNAPNIDHMLEFKEEDVNVKGISNNQSISWMAPEQGGVDGDITTFTMKIKTKDISGKNITLNLHNLGYKDENDKFVTLVKGNWKFNWKLNYKNESEKIAVNKDITLQDSKAVWKDITLSPLSVSVNYKITKPGKKVHFTQKEWEKYDGKDRLVVQYLDGTRIDSRFAELGDKYNEDSGNNESLEFDKITNSDQIESISFAGQTYVLNKNTNPEKRVKLSSKVANCTVEIPESIKDIVKMEEHENSYNNDLKCKEKVTIFWGEKNGSKMAMFSIHRLKGCYAPNDLEKKSPFMKYIGYRGNYTYTIEYGEIQDEAQNTNFADIMNKYIGNILPYFEYLK